MIVRALLLAFVLIGCQPVPSPGSPTIDASDASGESCFQPGPADECQAAGRHLCSMECRAAGVPLWRTPQGTPYAEVCRRAVKDGRDTMPRGGSRAHCLATIGNCTMVEECR